MRRRDVALLLGGVAAAYSSPLSAQSGRLWRIGQIPGSGRELAEALRVELARVGLTEGDRITLITRFSASETQAFEDAIAAIVPEIDLLTTWGTVAAVAAKKVAPPTLPVVFHSVGDPVAIGLVHSLSRPGGNMTGITFEAAMTMYGKRLEFLREINQTLRHVGVLRATRDANTVPAMTALEEAARQLGITLTVFDFHTASDLERVFGAIASSAVEALTVIAGAATYANRKAIADLALAHRLPSSHGFRETVQEGGLLSIGPNLVAMAQQGASYIKRIVEGAKPADLPVEQPTQHLVAVNLKTAKALGLTIPPTLLARADEVIDKAAARG